jgi:hypothetical protein
MAEDRRTINLLDELRKLREGNHSYSFAPKNTRELLGDPATRVEVGSEPKIEEKEKNKPATPKN